MLQTQHGVLLLSLFVIASSEKHVRALDTHDVLPPSSKVQFAFAEIDDAGKLVVITSTQAIFRVNDKGDVIEDDNPSNRRPRFVFEAVPVVYCVEIPYFETEEKDGKNIRVTKTRFEQRSKTIQKRKVIGDMDGYKMGLKPLRMSYDLDKTAFFDLERKRIASQIVRKKLTERRAIIVADTIDDIATDYCKLALNTNMMIVILHPAGEISSRK